MRCGGVARARVASSRRARRFTVFTRSTGGYIGTVSSHRRRFLKVYSAGRIAGVDLLAIFLVKVLLVKVLLITVGLRAADADAGR